MIQLIKNLWHRMMIRYFWYSPDGSMIKCNVNDKGQKIYHVPQSKIYPLVKIDPMKGERYVRTVQKAEDLGFRSSDWKGKF